MMNVKEWLNRARNIDREINRIENEISAEMKKKEEIFGLLTSATQRYSGDVVQSDRDPHKFDKIVEMEIAVDSLIDELVYEKERLTKVKSEINSVISRVRNSRYRDVLRARYLDNMTFEEISVSIHLSYKQTCRIHGRALLKVGELIDD